MFLQWKPPRFFIWVQFSWQKCDGKPRVDDVTKVRDTSYDVTQKIFLEPWNNTSTLCVSETLTSCTAYLLPLFSSTSFDFLCNKHYIWTHTLFSKNVAKTDTICSCPNPRYTRYKHCGTFSAGHVEKMWIIFEDRKRTTHLIVTIQDMCWWNVLNCLNGGDMCAPNIFQFLIQITFKNSSVHFTYCLLDSKIAFFFCFLRLHIFYFVSLLRKILS